MLRRILVPFDARGADESILPQVRRVMPAGAEVHFLHVVPGFTPPVGDVPGRRVLLHEEALQYLEGIRRAWPELRGLEHVRAGDPAEAILQVSLELNIDLIAMCTHARAGLAHWILGSVAETVIRKSWLPVLVSRPGAPAPDGPLRRILVPVDGSPHSAAILELVKPLALQVGADVVLLRVTPRVLDPVPMWASTSAPLATHDPLRPIEEIADALEEEGLTAWAAKAEGDPAEQIIKESRGVGADLIAMATHARVGFERAVVGSVTEAVLRHSELPVLVQRPVSKAKQPTTGESHG
jgi:nucleotide-binding universal stress UspA family protein